MSKREVVSYQRQKQVMPSWISLTIGCGLVLGIYCTVAWSAEGESLAIYRGVSTAVQFDISPPLSELALRTPTVPTVQKRDELRDRPTGLEGPFGPQDVDPVVQTTIGRGEIPAPSVSFDTLNNTCCTPPLIPLARWDPIITS